jgi:hypothetical protein
LTEAEIKAEAMVRVRRGGGKPTGDAIDTEGIDNYWSLLKRGLIGVFHHVSVGHLPEYLEEFQYRFNLRRVCDEERFASLMGQMQGRVLWYCQTPQPQNPCA